MFSFSHYIDFKHRNDGIELPVTDISNKLEKVDAKKILIINILAINQKEFLPVVKENGKIIEIPYLIKNKSIDKQSLNYVFKEIKK
jgi:hypothetical protein